MPMDVIDQANRLVASGQRQAAVDLVRGAADAGDPNALFAVANWRLFGMYGPRDEAGAHVLLDRAVATGSTEATRLRRRFWRMERGAKPIGRPPRNCSSRSRTMIRTSQSSCG